MTFPYLFSPNVLTGKVQLVAATLVLLSLRTRLSLCMCVSLPQSSGDELDEFEVELYKEGRGLGITIAGLVSEDTGGQIHTKI